MDNEWQIVEPIYDDYNHIIECNYCRTSYYENDTGYAEYECRMLQVRNTKGKLVYPECIPNVEYGCPLAFKYRTIED